MSAFGLDEIDLLLINQLFVGEAAVQRVSVLGSRARGTFRENSDIDLVLYGDLDQIIVGRILLALEELPLPYQFDVKSYEDISYSPLKEHVDTYGEVMYERQGFGAEKSFDA